MAYPDIAFIKIWNIVEAIYLINALKATFFNHRLGPTRTFFCWLK
jgi:hypothetical protein